MILRIHGTELARGQQVPLPWWADEPRLALGLVTLGAPAAEVDDDGNPTGWFLVSSPLIDKWDVWILDVMRAGWAYLDTLTDAEAEAVMAYQALTEWDQWAALEAEILSGKTSPAEAKERVIAYAIQRADSLGVNPPPEDEVNPDDV